MGTYYNTRRDTHTVYTVACSPIDILRRLIDSFHVPKSIIYIYFYIKKINVSPNIYIGQNRRYIEYYFAGPCRRIRGDAYTAAAAACVKGYINHERRHLGVQCYAILHCRTCVTRTLLINRFLLAMHIQK